MEVCKLSLTSLISGAYLFCQVSYGTADRIIIFTDIAQGDHAGITYQSHETPSDALWDQFNFRSLETPYDMGEDGPLSPGKSRSNPGLVIFDYDNDGDQDIYVTNAAGAKRPDGIGASSLYSNQFV